jgi:hypothetical protein
MMSGPVMVSTCSQMVVMVALLITTRPRAFKAGVAPTQSAISISANGACSIHSTMRNIYTKNRSFEEEIDSLAVDARVVING